MSSSLTSTFSTLIDRTFLLFLRHENPSICILGVYHAVLVVSVVVVVVVGGVSGGGGGGYA